MAKIIGRFDISETHTTRWQTIRVTHGTVDVLGLLHSPYGLVTVHSWNPSKGTAATTVYMSIGTVSYRGTIWGYAAKPAAFVQVAKEFATVAEAQAKMRPA